jgi:glycosyltransferase involved in cell wall biosynthesis
MDMSGLPPIRSAGFLSSAAAQSTVYCAADVFVIPSLAEAFGQTSLEAMACGTPVIGFDTGGIPDTVRPRQTGLLVPVGEDAALADAIRWMMTHGAEREAMGRNARAMAQTEFTLERQALGYLQLYRSILGA